MQTRSSPSLSTLHRMAEHANLSNWQNMSKNILYQTLQEQYDFERLRRVSNRKNQQKRNVSDNSHIDADEDLARPSLSLKSTKPKKSKGKRKRAKNDFVDVNEDADYPSECSRASKRNKLKKKATSKSFDPIMHCPLGKHVYEFVRPNGTCTRFNVESLVDYILATGDFTDPESRLPFSNDDLRMIDKAAEKAGLGKKSVYDAKNTPENVAHYADLNFRRDALLGLERLAGETVTEMLYIVENCDPDEAEMRLLMREFPDFAEYYRQIRQADADFAKQCMSSWRIFLAGPPNRPTRDDCGLLHVIQMFLRGCEAGTINIFQP